MANLIAGANYLLLATVTTGRVLLTAVLPDDKSLRVGDLDEVVWVLLRRNPLIQVSIIERTKTKVTYVKHPLHVS